MRTLADVHDAQVSCGDVDGRRRMDERGQQYRKSFVSQVRETMGILAVAAVASSTHVSHPAVFNFVHDHRLPSVPRPVQGFLSDYNCYKHHLKLGYAGVRLEA